MNVIFHGLVLFIAMQQEKKELHLIRITFFPDMG